MFLVSSEAMTPFYLIIAPFYFQGVGSSFLSLLWIIFQADCLFPLHLFGLVIMGFTMLFHLLHASLSFLLLNSQCLGSPFHSCIVAVLLTVQFIPSGWGWASTLWRFLGEGTVLMPGPESCLFKGKCHTHCCVIGFLWAWSDFGQPVC